MNRNLRKDAWFVLLAALLTGLPLWADVPPGQLQFTETEGGYAVARAEGAVLKGTLVIPAIHEGKPVVEIRKSAFQACHGVTAAVLPSSIRSIGQMAFAGCDSLREVALAEGIRTIGMAAFSGCERLASITLPASVTSIGGFSIFLYCRNLERIDVAPDNASYCSVQGVLYDRSMQTLVCCPGGYRGTVAVPEGVTTIVPGAFTGCGNLMSITVPNSVGNIGLHAFADCHNLKRIDVSPDNTSYCSVQGALYDRSMQTLIRCPGGYRGKIVLSASVSALGSGAFSGCSRLKAIRTAAGNASYCSVRGVLYDRSMQTLVCCPGGYRGTVVVPEGVTEIGRLGFFDCFSLKRIELPASLGSIGARVFWHCKALERLTCRAAMPPKTGKDTFNQLYEGDAHFRELPLYVPSTSVDAYHRDEFWGRFENIQTIGR